MRYNAGRDSTIRYEVVQMARKSLADVPPPFQLFVFVLRADVITRDNPRSRGAVYHGRSEVLASHGQLGGQKERHEGWSKPGSESTYVRIRAVPSPTTQYSARSGG